MPQAAAALEALGGTRLTLPRSWFAAQWQAGHLQRQHLQMAVERAADEGSSADSVAQQVNKLVAALESPDAQAQFLQRLPLITDLRDAGAPPRPWGVVGRYGDAPGQPALRGLF